MNANDGDPRVYPNNRPLDEQPHWIRDFPTDIPDDELVARREFVKFLVLTSGAFATGQCWIAMAGQPQPSDLPRKRIASLAELRARKVIDFRYPTDDDPCLLLRLGDERIVAYGQKCPHLACAVVPNLDRKELYCPCHNGRFEIVDGRPIAGPPRRPLPRVTLDIQDNEIFATGVELRTS